MQASKLCVLWGHKEALPLLSRSSLGEFWRRLPGRQAGNLSLAVLGQPQPRCENTINHAAFVEEIRQKKKEEKKKRCWNFKRTNKSLILRVFESLFPESFLGFGGDGDRGEGRGICLCLFGRWWLFICAGNKAGEEIRLKETWMLDYIFWCSDSVLLLSFSPNNSLFCDIRFFQPGFWYNSSQCSWFLN